MYIHTYMFSLTTSVNCSTLFTVRKSCWWRTALSWFSVSVTLNFVVTAAFQLQPRVGPCRKSPIPGACVTCSTWETKGPLGHLFLNWHYKHAVEQSGRYSVDLFDVGIFAQVPCVGHPRCNLWPLKITIQGRLWVKPVCRLWSGWRREILGTHSSQTETFICGSFVVSFFFHARREAYQISSRQPSDCFSIESEQNRTHVHTGTCTFSLGSPKPILHKPAVTPLWGTCRLAAYGPHTGKYKHPPLSLSHTPHTHAHTHTNTPKCAHKQIRTL